MIFATKLLKLNIVRHSCLVLVATFLERKELSNLYVCLYDIEETENSTNLHINR